MERTIENYLTIGSVYTITRTESVDYTPPYKKRSRRSVSKGHATKNLNKFNKDKKRI